jgi:hypothetical protein
MIVALLGHSEGLFQEADCHGQVADPSACAHWAFLSNQLKSPTGLDSGVVQGLPSTANVAYEWQVIQLFCRS